MRVGYADHAGVAGRRGYAPATQTRCNGEGRDFTPNAVFQEGKGKLMPLPSYRKRIFGVLSRSSPSARKRDLTEIEYPLLVKRVFSHPLLATAATPLSPRRPPPPMRVGYADHAGVAGRRGYAPATHGALQRGGEGSSHQTQSSKRVRAKLMPLPSYRKRIFGVLSRSSPSARKRDLTEIEYPLLVKRVFSHPLLATAATPLSPDGHRRRCESAMPTTQASPAVGLRARYAGALQRGGRDFTPNAVFPRG